MKLKSVVYHQYKDDLRSWELPKMVFGDVNLVVGRNASGKTRSLNVIHGFAHLVSGQRSPELDSGHYSVEFEDSGRVMAYQCDIEVKKVRSERLTIDGKEFLTRGENGEGTIFAEELKTGLSFKMADSQLAVVAKRDLKQHSFLDRFYQWGIHVQKFDFGTPLGKDCLGVLVKDFEDDEARLRDQKMVIGVFRRGIKRFGDEFRQSVIIDMGRLGYDLENVDTSELQSVQIIGPAPFQGRVVGLNVKEKDLLVETDQNDMSQGMFRALSLIVQTTYAYLGAAPSCILIDDIGEGLDFERSSNLIRVVTEKARKSTVQIIMTTNDRFIMNVVPLEDWTVLQRGKGKVQVFNYVNSKDRFDDFKFTGLNNFDFLATDFLASGLPAK